MMRRKSTRANAKSSPEKSKKPESPVRKSRRQSKRRKKSTTSESSDESPDELLSQIASEAKAAIKTEEPVWKVTSSASPSGEVQKLKISLTRPANTETVTKRETRRSRSITAASDNDSEHFSGWAKSNNEEATEQDNKKNKDVEIKGKGKSKDKHKHQKSSQFSEEGIEKTCEISANIQVTTESPSIINRVDDEYLRTEIEKDISNANDEISDKTHEDQTTEPKNEMNREESEAVQDTNEVSADQNAQAKIETENKTEVAVDQPVVTTFTNEEYPVGANEETPEDVANAPQQNFDNEIDSNQKDNLVEETPVVELPSSAAVEASTDSANDCVAPTEPETSEIPVISMSGEVEDKVIVSAVSEEIPTGTTECREDFDKTPEKEDSTENTQEDTEPANTNQDLPVEAMDLDMSESENLRNLQQQIIWEEVQHKPKQETDKAITLPIDRSNQRKFKLKHPNTLPTEAPIERKKSWGKTIKSLPTMPLLTIDVKSIQSLCPEIVLPGESDVKLLSSTEKKKNLFSENRKISTEEPDKTVYKTQTSVNSSSSLDEAANIIAMNRKISIVDDSVSKLRPPPSPAKNPVSAVLFITNLVRPFTLKQLKELLERTGKIQEDGFWTDRIKSKCYVHYVTVEEAEATRNALHGVQWPVGNGKKLIIDYATPEDLENAKNPPVPQAPPVEDAKIPEKENEEPVAKQTKDESEDLIAKEKRSREGHVREWDVGKGKEPSRTRSRSRDRHERKRHSKRTPSPLEDFVSKKHQKLEEPVPQKLMDDLFQKTKAMPSIYWQPLSPEEIATKQQQRLMRMAEHKRRMEETSRNRTQDFPRGPSYRRRYD